MPAPALPTSPSDITVDWLSAALSTPLRSFRVEREIHGTATKLLLGLEPEDAASALPRRLWLKAGMEVHSELMGAAGLYENEARFYAQLVPQLQLTLPRCWYAGFDAQHRQGIVLLEDLNERGARFAGVDLQPELDSVRSTLDQLARLHARWWGDAALDRFGWLQLMFKRNDPSSAWFASHTPAHLQHYIELPRGDRMPASTRDTKRIFQAFWTLVDTMDRPPLCLVHGDAHFGNTFIQPDGSAGYIDWQTPHQGCWAHDVAYYLGSALPVDARREHEVELLREYLDRLAAHGAQTHGAAVPSFDQVWLAYRRNMAYGLIAWLLNPEGNAFQPEALNTLCITRYSAAVADLESFAVLGV